MPILLYCYQHVNLITITIITTLYLAGQLYRNIYSDITLPSLSSRAYIITSATSNISLKLAKITYSY
jgi:hypothetical protein